MSILYEDPLDQGKPPVFRREIHVGDVGTAIVLRIHDLSPNVFDPEAQGHNPPVLDVSTATARQMLFTKPEGASPALVLVTAALATVSPGLPGQVGDGTDGYIQYDTVADFLDIAGLWQVQGILTFGTDKWYSQIRTFQVHSNLEAP